VRAAASRRSGEKLREKRAAQTVLTGLAPADEDAPTAVVRVYEEGKRRVVRDPGIRETNIPAVLHEDA
jgi:hypothetical protein